MLIPTSHSDILDSALRLAFSASQNDKLTPAAISADIALLRAHSDRPCTSDNTRTRINSTIATLQRDGRRYNYYFRPQGNAA